MLTGLFPAADQPGQSDTSRLGLCFVHRICTSSWSGSRDTRLRSREYRRVPSGNRQGAGSMIRLKSALTRPQGDKKISIAVNIDGGAFKIGLLFFPPAGRLSHRFLPPSPPPASSGVSIPQARGDRSGSAPRRSAGRGRSSGRPVSRAAARGALPSNGPARTTTGPPGASWWQSAGPPSGYRQEAGPGVQSTHLISIASRTQTLGVSIMGIYRLEQDPSTPAGRI